MKIAEELPEFYPETILAIQAARKGAKVLLDVYESNFSAEIRDGEPVTEADRISNEVILKELADTKYLVLSEESLDGHERLKQQKIWVIDPLDGTSDFVNKTGEFSILIGLVDTMLPILGVIYQPINDILYVAEKGRGAYQQIKKDWHKLSVSSISDISMARVVMSRHHLEEKEKKFLNKLGVTKFIQQGSCGLKVATIAEGKAELYLTMTDKIKQWDTCAANCIIAEAGGKMTDMLGNPLQYNTAEVRHQNGILASNGNFFESVIRIYKEFV